MAFENPYLVDFAPIFFAVMKAKGVNPAKVELIIFDEEADEHHPFERAGVLDVLHQLSGDINALTICTDRPEYFSEFVERTYEKTDCWWFLRLRGCRGVRCFTGQRG